MDGPGWRIQVSRNEYDDVSDGEEYLENNERMKSQEGSIFRLLDHELYLTLQPTTPAYQHPLGPRPSTQNVARSHTDSLTLMRAHACPHTHAHARVRPHTSTLLDPCTHAAPHAQVPHTSMS